MTNIISWKVATGAFIFYLLLIGVTSATPILDQYSIAVNPNSCFGAFTSSYYAQSFIPSMSGNLTSVRLALSSQNGVADDVNLTVEIRDHDNVSNCPNCYSLATANIPYFNTNLHWENVIFGSPPYLKAGKIYYIVVTSSTNYVWSCGYSYPNGSMYSSANGYSSWYNNVDYDWGFETYIDPSAEPQPDLQINDSDSDGVPDTCDLCPNIIGTKENRGCPSINATNMSIGYSALVATGQNTYVQSSNGTFGLLLKGQSKTINNSVILNNTGDISATVEARFNDSRGGVFGLVSGANVLNATNFALGLTSILVPLNNSGADVQVAVAAPGVTALDARLGVPSDAVAGDYGGTVILTFSNSV